jgi:ABC-2 type transport system ATP-binding protein
VTKQPEIILSLSGVTKRFGSFTALDDISLVVQKGHIHGFLGPNGAGKSTTIKLLMDFIRPTKGEVRIFGMDAHEESVAIKREVGYLAGDMELYDNLTGDQYLRYVAHLRGERDYDHLMKFAHELDAVLGRRLGTLSRGNKQKISLLAALLGDPDLLILDEPTTGLDPLMQQKFYAVLKDYARRGKTVFMSSHILSEVQEVCDRVTFMKQGKIIQTIDVDRLLASSKRHVIMEFSSRATVLDPPASLGAEHLRRTKTSLAFDVEMASRAVLRWIASQDIQDVSITESNLDSVFMGMYEGESK